MPQIVPADAVYIGGGSILGVLLLIVIVLIILRLLRLI
jgi:hypothetical protein